MNTNYDLAIIGGGPGGVSAGVYAARKKLKTVLIAETIGGQSTVSLDIQNWIGFPSISGEELAKSFKKHLQTYADKVLDINEGERVSKIEKENGGFLITTNKKNYSTKTILITTGSHRRKLEVKGATEYENKGITYCATCDAPMFGDKDVVVIGGGNAAFETALQLATYANKVNLLNRSADFKADAITVSKVLANKKITAIKNATPVEIKGKTFVTSIVYEDEISGKKTEIPAEGIFVEIGLLPSTNFVEGLVKMNQYKQIIVDPKTQKTSMDGIWAAGDCTDGLFHQNNIAAGDAVKALEDLYLYLHLKK